MRCLLLHPNDDVAEVAWHSQDWDRIIDLGIAGRSSYQQWSRKLKCEVEPSQTLDCKDFAALREMFAFAKGRIVDSHGFDWWDLIAIRWLDSFELFVATSKLLQSFSSRDDIFITPSGVSVRRFAAARSINIRTLPNMKKPPRWAQRIASLVALRPQRVLDVLADKYDGRYRIRRHFDFSRANCCKPVVLLPSAYVNASRLASEYAESLPEMRFLLVSTRRSGWLKIRPENVSQTRLASYAIRGSSSAEFNALLRAWKGLCASFPAHSELDALCRAGCFSSGPFLLREGLALRDCWLEVFRSEPISGVFCADEKNAYTRLPLLIAQQQGLPALSCHHGALDGRYRFTDVYADRILAKGRMEWDYLTRSCGISEHKVCVAAPRRELKRGARLHSKQNRILFFSEPYESSLCRAREVYAEILPRLMSLAVTYGCKVVIKLHPFESGWNRKKLVRSVVPNFSSSQIQIVSGPLKSDMLQDIWFAATVSSTAAVDCALHGVPTFLFTWLDRYGYGYAEQFAKFGAAKTLCNAEEIDRIPVELKSYPPATIQDLWRPAEPQVLAALLSGRAADQQYLREKMWA